jgi:hypothetical protein
VGAVDIVRDAEKDGGEDLAESGKIVVGGVAVDWRAFRRDVGENECDLLRHHRRDRAGGERDAVDSFQKIRPR